MVQAFHETFQLGVAPTPTIPAEAVRQLRLTLIREELNELSDALASGELVAIAKELADLLYVVYGAAVVCGIDLEPVFRAVHRSNMSKVGGHRREDGKLVKPAGFVQPDLAPILAAQRAKRKTGPRRDAGRATADAMNGRAERARQDQVS